MDTKEAYELTLEKIEELGREGIEVTIKPFKSLTTPYGIVDQLVERNNEKYDRLGGIPPNKWFYVTFSVLDESHAIKIHKAGDYLGMCGITFDVGGWQGYRDWKLDWSFSYTGKEDEDWREARDEVEDLIKRGE